LVLERARGFAVPVLLAPVGKQSAAKVVQEKLILEKLDQVEVDYLLLAGYMRILSPEFVERYPYRIINIHPSKLPDFPGRDGYGDAFQAGVKESAITIHFVDAGVDTGPLIVQEKFPRNSSDRLEDFRQRGLAIEHQLYPKIMSMLARDQIVVSTDGRVSIRM
jgi:phosphoribosylglycinamide formyltransferase 1